MFSQYFGHYLLKKKALTPEQLSEVLELLDSVHIKLGVLAMNSGLLSADQVDHIQQAQTKVDKKFGELCVEMGYLTETQVEELLATQRQGHLLLSQALLDKGYMSLKQLEAYLNEYLTEYNLSETDLMALEKGDIDGVIHALIDLGSSPSQKIQADYLALLVRSVIRFIDEIPRLDGSRRMREFSSPWFTYQEILGPVNLFTGIAGDDKVLMKLAGKFAGKNFLQFGELAQDSTSEFLNLINGIFLVNMSNNGLELEMKPQQMEKDVKLINLDQGYVIPVCLSWGSFDLIISDSAPTVLS